MEFNNNQKACIYSLLYSDIFDFPLTDEELWHSLISDKKIERSTVKKTARRLSKIITYQDGYYSLKGREEIIDQRRKRTKITQGKLKIAKNIAKYLTFIPSIQFIGITGRLSHMDADIEDDIDMFFITRKNSLWTTRLLILAVLELLQVRRTRNDTNPQNKICPNLIIDESALAWPVKKRDIYTAHEIIHICPLFVRNNIDQKFLNSNKWIRRYYANSCQASSIKQYLGGGKTAHHLVLEAINFILTLPPVEYVISKLQMAYMKNKRTNETILPNFLAFHPQDKREEILSKFSTKIKQINRIIDRGGGLC